MVTFHNLERVNKEATRAIIAAFQARIFHLRWINEIMIRLRILGLCKFEADVIQKGNRE